MTRKEIKELLFRMPWPELRQAARRECRRARNNHVFIRGLIEFSNVCRRNCRYCGLRQANRSVRRYCLTADTILAAACGAAAAGVDTIVLQSGESCRSPEWLAGVISRIKQATGLPLTLSVGEQPAAWYALWKEVGADRFLIRHETADPHLYAHLHPGYTLAQRRRSQTALAELGYALGTGFLVGVPGQHPETLIDDILLTQEMHAVMCGVGPFIPQKDTPLARKAHGSIPLTLRCMAVLRLAVPRLNIPATTALATLDPLKGQQDGLEAGGNVLMPSFTPPTMQAAYRIYDGKLRVDMSAVRRAVENAGYRHSLPPTENVQGKQGTSDEHANA